MSAPDLVFNSNVRIHPKESNGRIVGYLVRAPVRGDSLRESLVLASDAAEVFHFLARLTTPAGDLELDPESAPMHELATLGVFLREEELSQPVEPSIDPIEATTNHSASGASKRGAPVESWVVNESIVAQRGPDPPPSLAGRLPKRLPPPLRDPPIAWVEAPETLALAPYRLDAEILQSLRPGHLPPPLAPETRDLLARSGLLVPPLPSSTRAELEAENRRRAAELRETGMTRVSGWLPPVHLALLRRYYRRRIEQGYVQLRKEGVEVRYVSHNEPMAIFWHHQLTRVMSRIAGTPVKPSYVYFSSYVPGAELPWHLDREQCEYSVSLLVDYQPEPEGLSPWPLLLEGRDGRVVSVFQRPGDALVYRGRELRHGRRPLPPGHRSTHLFFHYVDESFSGDLK